ncbi:MAG: ral secretion pathway protein [Deltaproteobacteria bacterium]|nr:ral secretion pathway protein [Deltaproteobacteria bacterium]
MIRKPLKLANDGFTLIEIMMVMVLILIILGVSTVFFANRLPSENLNAAGREMSAMLRFARLLAKGSGEPHSVLIDLDTGRYGIPGVQTRTIPKGITVRITDPREGDIMRGEHSIVFNESGGADWGRITLTGGKKVLRIDLDPVLGAAVLRE